MKLHCVYIFAIIIIIIIISSSSSSSSCSSSGSRSRSSSSRHMKIPCWFGVNSKQMHLEKKISANMHARNWPKWNLPQSKFHFPRIFVKISSGLKLNEVMSHVVWVL